jgi:hypothetical protein
MLGNTQVVLLVLGIALTVLVIVKLNEIDSKLLELQNSQSEPPQDFLQKMFRPITHPPQPVQKSNKDDVDESDSDDDEPERIKEESDREEEEEGESDGEGEGEGEEEEDVPP